MQFAIKWKSNLVNLGQEMFGPILRNWRKLKPLITNEGNGMLERVIHAVFGFSVTLSVKCHRN